MGLKLSVLSISLLLSLFSVVSYSQHVKLKGSIVDDNLNKVSGATIVLTNMSDNSVLATVISDGNGIFSLTSKTNTPSELTVNHVSYKSQSFSIPTKCDSTFIICLEDVNYTLGDVTVVGKGKRIYFKEDGTVVVSVESIVGYETQQVSDLLKKLPGVFTSPSAGLQLNGRTVTILVDGKETKMNLNALPATMFADAELMSNPSAEYDGAAKAVINLVTKRNKRDGSQSYIGISGIVNHIGQIDGKAMYSAMIKKKNTYINNSLVYDSHSFAVDSQDSIYYKDSGNTLLSHSANRERAKRFMNNTNFIQVMKHDQELSANLYLFGGIERNKSELIQTFLGKPTETYKSTGKPTVLHLSGNVEYKTGDNLPFTIKASYGFSVTDVTSKQTMNVTTSGQPSFGYKQPIHSLDMQHTAKVDYSQNFAENKLNLKFGVKDNLILSDYKNTYLILYGERPLENTTYNSNENVFSLYTSLYYKPKEKLSFYFAGRMEHTYYQILNSITGGMSTGGTSSHSYVNLMPYASVTYRPSKVYMGSLFFSTALTRPNFSFLMPGINYENDYSYSVGNPMLLPKYNYTVGLANTFLQSFYININGLYDKNLILAIMKEKGNGVTENTFENCVDQMGASVSLGVPFNFFKEKLTGQFNFTGAVGKYVNAKEGFSLVPNRKNSYSYSAAIDVSYRITSRFSVSGYVDYLIKEKSLQVNTSGYAGLDLVARYAFLKDKSFNLFIYATDVFNTREVHDVYYYGNIVRTSSQASSSQSFTIGLSYKFGRGQNVDKGISRDPNDTSRIF